MIRPLVLALLLLAAVPAAARDFVGKAPGPFAQSMPGAPTGNDNKVGKTPIIGTFRSTAGGGNITSFPGMAFGPANASRYIVVVAEVLSSNSFGSLLIGGNAATNVLAVNNSTTRIVVAVLNVPTGTSGTVTLNYSTPGTALINVYSMLNAASPTTPATTNSTTTYSPSVTVDPGGWVLGLIASLSTLGSFSGLAVDSNSTSGVVELATASSVFLSGGTPSITLTAGGTQVQMGTLRWNP